MLAVDIFSPELTLNVISSFMAGACTFDFVEKMYFYLALLKTRMTLEYNLKPSAHYAGFEKKL